MAFYFHYCAVDVERRAPATNGSLFDLPYHGDDGVADDGRGSLPACYAAYIPDEPYAVATVFADPAARQHHDDGDVCLSCGTQTHFRKRNPFSERHGIFRYRYGVSGHRGTMAANQQSALPVSRVQSGRAARTHLSATDLAGGSQ